MTSPTTNSTDRADGKSPLSGPDIVPEFEAALTRLCAVARQGQRTDSELYNPSEEWIVGRMPIFQDLPAEKQSELLAQAQELEAEAVEANAAGRASSKVWPETVFRLDNGGLAFFSQLGVVRRPDLTQYFVEGFTRNRDALAFSEDNQRLFTQVFHKVCDKMEASFASGEAIVQTDRQICDAPGRSFHARQLLFGTRYMQAPYMWRRLTFELPQDQWQESPDILEVSVPHWMDDLDLADGLKQELRDAGITQLVFKAPTRGLSLHFGFRLRGRAQDGTAVHRHAPGETEQRAGGAGGAEHGARAYPGRRPDQHGAGDGGSVAARQEHADHHGGVGQQRTGRHPEPATRPRGRGLPDERRYRAAPAAGRADSQPVGRQQRADLPRHRRDGKQFLRGAIRLDSRRRSHHLRRAAGSAGRYHGGRDSGKRAGQGGEPGAQLPGESRPQHADDPVAAGTAPAEGGAGPDRQDHGRAAFRLGARAHGEHQPGLLAGGDAAEHSDPHRCVG